VTRHVLAKRHRQTLAAFASSNVLVALDFDGTLAPIVSDHTRARMRTRTRRLLAAVARRYPCVVISGRARHDLSRLVGGVPVWHLSGNHGLEPWAEDARYPRQVREWARCLERELRHHEGVVIEDKIYSLTIHYRNVRRKAGARRAIAHAISRLGGARSLGGKHSVSVLPREAPDKGAALEHARRLLACDTAIYVGDDETDEDAFRAAHHDRLLAVRVGRRVKSKATYHLRSQNEIDAFLEALLACRQLRRAGPPRGLGSAGS
jgi:trehalose 6-phosphate phosphatase